MSKQKLEMIIRSIALANGMSPTQVRLEMEIAMREAQASNDPEIQKRWAKIPHKGKDITLEEFIEFAAGQITDG